MIRKAKNKKQTGEYLPEKTLQKIEEIFNWVVASQDTFDATAIRSRCTSLGIPDSEVSKSLCRIFRSKLAKKEIRRSGSYNLSPFNHKPQPIYSRF